MIWCAKCLTVLDFCAPPILLNTKFWLSKFALHIFINYPRKMYFKYTLLIWRNSALQMQACWMWGISSSSEARNGICCWNYRTTSMIANLGWDPRWHDEERTPNEGWSAESPMDPMPSLHICTHQHGVPEAIPFDLCFCIVRLTSALFPLPRRSVTC